MKKLYITFILTFLTINSFWFVNLKDPHLLPIRDIETLCFLLSTILIAIAVTPSKSKPLKALIYFSSFALAISALIKAAEIERLKDDIQRNVDNKYSTFNHRLIIGFDDKNEISTLSKNGIAGIFLSSRNIKGETPDSLRSFLSQLQEERKQLGLPPLFVTTDQEGGPVSRLSPLIERQPSLSQASMENQSILDYGILQGKQLHDLGINVNFSPVVDLKPNSPPGKLDFHSLIETRAISSNPQQVIDISLQYINGLNASGVIATIKHFPGLARVSQDTHHFSAHLSDIPETLKGSDWLPFIKLTKATNSWVMLSHVTLTKIDKNNPVSTSSIVIDDLIRNELNIDSVLITDDLTMGAAYNRGFCKSVSQSYMTSVNYLLISYDHEKYYDAVRCLYDQQENR